MTLHDEIERACQYCGLPVARSWWRWRDDRPEEPVYCCYGCRVASEIAGQADQRGESNWLLARLGLSIFLTINVVMFTMALWTQDVYEPQPDAATAFAVSLDGLFRYLALLLSLPVVWLLGAPLARGAWQSIRSGVPSTDPLLVVGVAASYVYSAFSVFRGQGQVYFEVGCVVLVMVTLGRWLEATGKLRATEALDALEKLLPAEVRVIRPDGEQLVPLDELQAGDRVRVLAGERFAADGRIVRGRAAIDEQVFTGESRPSIKEPSDAVLSGTLNLDGELIVDVTATAAAGALRRLIEAVHEARATKGKYQRLADRLSHYFLPGVATIALASGLWHGVVDGFETGVLSGLAVILIACPCALALATPLAVWTAVGRAARSQVLFRHGEALEQLAGVGAVAFDKTGTLTTGTSQVRSFSADDLTPRQSVLNAAASLAATSTHSLSAAIAQFTGLAELAALCPAAASECSEARTLPGRGVSARTPACESTVYLGSLRLMEESDLAVDVPLQRSLRRFDEGGHPVVCIGWQGRVRGVFAFDEQLRPEANEAIASCRKLGLEVSVLSGDASACAERLAATLAVPVEAGLLPAEKVRSIGRLHKDCRGVAMVGDGINDAPALAAADVGIALGCGADVSRQSADVCLLTNDLSRVPWAVGLARATVSIIRQNLFWAFSYNVLGIGLAASGRLSPVWAAAAMVASSVLVIGNSLRLSSWNS
ncbi:MAG TPA: cation-translocating P-type ATPase [Pirellulales bacterium]|nr:cation-translocating P-type ATPase [Pirellulales bacterium]